MLTLLAVIASALEPSPLRPAPALMYSFDGHPQGLLPADARALQRTARGGAAGEGPGGRRGRARARALLGARRLAAGERAPVRAGQRCDRARGALPADRGRRPRGPRRLLPRAAGRARGARARAAAGAGSGGPVGGGRDQSFWTERRGRTARGLQSIRQGVLRPPRYPDRPLANLCPLRGRGCRHLRPDPGRADRGQGGRARRRQGGDGRGHGRRGARRARPGFQRRLRRGRRAGGDRGLPGGR